MTEHKLNLHQLIIYRKLLDDQVVKKASKLIDMINSNNYYEREELQELYYEIYYNLIEEVEKREISGNLWQDYIFSLILEDENVFSLKCEKSSKNINSKLYDYAMHDIDILRNLYHLDWETIERDIEIKNISLNNTYAANSNHNKFYRQYSDKIKELQNKFSTDEAMLESFLDNLINHYNTLGCGKMAKYSAFKWKEKLIGIQEPDPVELEDLVGYQSQKEILIKNTEAFVQGKKANNVLLYGDKGTGKSSSVKALLNRYAHKGLRMIELSKDQLKDFADIIQMIKNRGQRFIIFIDDLSFEDFETDYKYIKANIEGGLEVRPDNTLIYATTNRRHLVRENWSDQRDPNPEIRSADSVEEKLSLANRFGITLTYISPNKNQYLDIVEKLAKKHNIDMSIDNLRKEAIKWEMRFHGRSGRTAQQFIDYLLGE